MDRHGKLDRRTFLRWAGRVSVALAGSGLAGLLSSCSADTHKVSAAGPTVAPQEPLAPDVTIALKAEPAKVEILPGKATEVWHYQGSVLKGDPATLTHIPGSYLGPILRLRKGQRVRIEFTNELPETSIVHWHGLHLPEAADGHPRLAIDPGASYTYEFEVMNRAGTYWYHPHPHGRTGSQVYRGLAGLLLVSDDDETAARLPVGEYDVPLVVQDRAFDQDNQLVYVGNGMAEWMSGFLGDRILVNGQPDFALSASTRPYRLRILNGSNARTYKLAWDDGTPLTVIATDGGLLERPVERAYVTVGPAERVELWADFGRRELGTELRLQSLPFFGGEAGGMGMMGGGMMGSVSTVPNGDAFTVMRVRFEQEGSEGNRLPDQLSTPLFHDEADAVNRRRPRSFDIAMRGMSWFLNGRRFEMEQVSDNEIVRLGDLEMWEFSNQGGPMLMIHPMHVHNVQFQVIERQVLPALEEAWNTVRSGYVDEGWKDTVLLMPGERAKILLKFEDYEGLYLYHCHNLEHEDMGMMRNYRVES